MDAVTAPPPAVHKQTSRFRSCSNGTGSGCLGGVYVIQGQVTNAMVPPRPQPAVPCLRSQQETADDSKRKHLSLAMWVTETFLSAVRVFWTAAPLIHRRNQQEVITTVSLRRISLKCSGQRLWTITSCRIRTLQQIRAPTPLRSPAQHLQVHNCPRTSPGFVWLLLRV